MLNQICNSGRNLFNRANEAFLRSPSLLGGLLAVAGVVFSGRSAFADPVAVVIPASPIDWDGTVTSFTTRYGEIIVIAMGLMLMVLLVVIGVAWLKSGAKAK